MRKTDARRIACSLAASVMYSHFECAETLNEYPEEERKKIEAEWFEIADQLNKRSGGAIVNWAQMNV